MNNTPVVNFFGGPGTGKSTVMAHCFALLKWQGLNVEMATEYAKDKVWEKSSHVLSNQEYVFGKQYKRIKQLQEQVDVVLTDGPILMSLVYHDDEPLRNLVLARNNEFKNINIFLERMKKYNPSGRYQTEQEARDLDFKIWNILKQHTDSTANIPATQEMVPAIVEYISDEVLDFKGG